MANNSASTYHSHSVRQGSSVFALSCTQFNSSHVVGFQYFRKHSSLEYSCRPQKSPFSISASKLSSLQSVCRTNLLIIAHSSAFTCKKYVTTQQSCRCLENDKQRKEQLVLLYNVDDIKDDAPEVNSVSHKFYQTLFLEERAWEQSYQ